MTVMRLKCSCGAEIFRDDAQQDYPKSTYTAAIAAWKEEHRGCAPTVVTTTLEHPPTMTNLWVRFGKEIGRIDAIRILELGMCGEDSEYGKGWDAALRNRIEELRKVTP